MPQRRRSGTAAARYPGDQVLQEPPRPIWAEARSTSGPASASTPDYGARN
ncbi:mlr5955 [Mesorhizobium japonicum MAFF 303099]|uniref:Mlr5955 protein n=1 Tax=Mesorhizobium japonicum (strain LMG 29417 / CECT 9101 / MAFF 303099) TaxID=266835 RepID=Q98AL2_RHILO|nr:mlr5955 [Mesorhizobium japonicum MAFF 303099]